MGSGSSQPAPSSNGDGSKPTKSAMQKQIESHGYPEPAPPSTKKEEIFDLNKFKEIDQYASKIPNDILYGTYEEIAEHVTKNCVSDIEKLRALFTWATSIDVASLQATLEQLPEDGRPLDYLLKIHWKMGNHAFFFTKLCRAAGLPSVIVTGINKSAAYELGQKIDKKLTRAAWNSVYVDGNWRFIDVYWASTCVVGKKSGEWNLMDIDGDMMDEEQEKSDGDVQHQVNEGYFMTDPDILIFTHFPDEQKWQLLEEPIKFQTFEERVYIRERFFDAGQKLLNESYHKCVVEPKNGELEFQFGLVEDKDRTKLMFTYKLFRARMPGEKPPEVPYERFVFFHKKGQISIYRCRFPVTGKYRMDMYGKEEGEHPEFDLCASYLIDCKVSKANCKPFPDCPENGWGLTAAAEKLGITPTSHPDPIVKSKDGMIEIRMKAKDALNIRYTLQSNDADEAELKNQAYTRREGDEVIVSMRLPKKGEYALNLYASKEGTDGEMPLITNYLVNVERDNACLKPFPKLHGGNTGKGAFAKDLGVQAITEPSGTLKTEDGNIDLEFEHDIGVDMFCQIDNVDLDKKLLSESGNVSNGLTSSKFEAQLPLIGEYSVNTYARMKDDPTRLYHVHSYLVDSRQTSKGEIKVSRQKQELISGSTADNKVVLHLPKTENDVVAELQKTNARTSKQKNQMTARKTDSRNSLQVKLPEVADYTMEVFEKKPSGTLLGISTYALQRCQLTEEMAAELADKEAEERAQRQAEEDAEKMRKQFTPEQIIAKNQKEAQERAWQAERNALKAALQTQDQQTIAAAIAKFEASNVPDDKGQLAKAKELLTFLQISSELTTGMAQRNLKQLESACDAAEKHQLQKKLGLQLKMAVKVRDQLRRLEKLRHAIMNLDQKTIAEIKSYAKPPEGVHKVMIATFLLLGNSEKELKEWPKVVVLIGKTGKESLKRRITQDFKVDKLKPAVAKKAKAQLSSYELDVIRDLSAGAATFYVWVTGMVEECEARNS